MMNENPTEPVNTTQPPTDQQPPADTAPSAQPEMATGPDPSASHSTPETALPGGSADLGGQTLEATQPTATPSAIGQDQPAQPEAFTDAPRESVPEPGQLDSSVAADGQPAPPTDTSQSNNSSFGELNMQPIPPPAFGAQAHGNMQQPSFGAGTPSAAVTDSSVSKYSGLAIASMVLGILSIIPPGLFIPFLNLVIVLTGAAAVVLGIIALKKIKQSPLKGKGLAITGIVTGAIAAVISLVITVGLGMLFSNAASNYSTDFPEDASYGTMTYDDVSDAVSTGMSKSQVAEALGSSSDCETESTNQEKCTYIGGNMERGVKVQVDYSSTKATGVSVSSTKFD